MSSENNSLRNGERLRGFAKEGEDFISEDAFQEKVKEQNREPTKWKDLPTDTIYKILEVVEVDACTQIAAADDNNIILSNYSLTSGTTVQVGCKKFGQRLTLGVQPVTCTTGSWSTSQISYKCEWNGDLTTYEKLIIGTSSAGAGVLMLGIFLICCLAPKYSDKRNKKENDVDSYPPSAINEKVGYAQYSGGYGNGYGGGYGYGGGGSGSGGGEIRGHRPSGKYEKQITPDQRMDSRNEPLKRDPILWSNASPSRDTDRSDQTSGYQFYTGKNSSQHDNRAFERNEYDRGSGYRDTGYHGTNYMQGKREDFRWNGQLPRAHMPRDDRYNRHY